MKCMLSKDINQCPFYSQEKEQCTNENSGCSFKTLDDKKPMEINRYIRKPRWYEKYYK